PLILQTGASGVARAVSVRIVARLKLIPAPLGRRSDTRPVCETYIKYVPPTLPRLSRWRRAEGTAMYLITDKGGTAPPKPNPPGGRPSATLLLTEPFRGLFDHAALVLATPALAAAPRGDGHGVLVLPGLLASDSSTIPLRAFLRAARAAPAPR